MHFCHVCCTAVVDVYCRQLVAVLGGTPGGLQLPSIWVATPTVLSLSLLLRPGNVAWQLPALRSTAGSRCCGCGWRPMLLCKWRHGAVLQAAGCCVAAVWVVHHRGLVTAHAVPCCCTFMLLLHVGCLVCKPRVPVTCTLVPHSRAYARSCARQCLVIDPCL